MCLTRHCAIVFRVQSYRTRDSRRDVLVTIYQLRETIPFHLRICIYYETTYKIRKERVVDALITSNVAQKTIVQTNTTHFRSYSFHQQEIHRMGSICKQCFSEEYRLFYLFIYSLTHLLCFDISTWRSLQTIEIAI